MANLSLLWSHISLCLFFVRSGSNREANKRKATRDDMQCILFSKLQGHKFEKKNHVKKEMYKLDRMTYSIVTLILQLTRNINGLKPLLTLGKFVLLNRSLKLEEMYI